MAKQKFSSSIDASLHGRSSDVSQKKSEPEIAPVEASKEVHKESSKKGRKKKTAAEKKKQMVLTLNADKYNMLLEWAASKPRSAPNYVSDFVEEHIDEIIK